ncbi:TraI/MobA(P) family conjugative relaxase [Polycladidibacter hongkongensis]|uniref:TraI/MobA(P) family conjugative relaxase n=1 Tax=Polycladidibacter hongkongensis TaxID=1647556 RepID=UPI0008365F05|nr:TraI/MobA(P) family conjugative relaxase [Pseudovibrio hongkongensis]
MIAKRSNRTVPAPFKELAEYVAAAKETGEKLDELWISNCLAGDRVNDLELAIAEVEVTQSMNTRSKADKNYHVVVSFRDEKPSSEALRDIEKEFSKALGYENHQRVAATHINTDNFHMHIVYSKVCPQTYRNVQKRYDYLILDKVCKQMELKHGLKIDNGIGEAERRMQKERDKEHNTWEESFTSYLKGHREALMKMKEKAQTWEQFHSSLDALGVGVKRRANGLVFYNLDGPETVKATGIDRGLSKAKLEEKFGVFMPRSNQRDKRKLDEYKQRPVIRSHERSKLWEEYRKKKSKERNWRAFLRSQLVLDAEAAQLVQQYQTIFSTFKRSAAAEIEALEQQRRQAGHSR